MTVFTRLKELWDATTSGRGTQQSEAKLFDFVRDNVPAMLAEVERLQYELSGDHGSMCAKERELNRSETENTELKAEVSRMNTMFGITCVDLAAREARIEKAERALGPLVEKLQVLSVRMNTYGPGMPVTYCDAMWNIAREAEKILEGGDEK